MEKQEIEKWKPVPTSALIEHIENNYHTQLRVNLPAIQQLFQKVLAVHGESHPELLQVFELYAGFSNRMLFHILQEEQIVFPMLLAIERSARCEDLDRLVSPLMAMEMDHDQDTSVMKEIRLLTSNFTPPANACMSYKSLFLALKALIRELEIHIHIEDEILFKRFKLKGQG